MIYFIIAVLIVLLDQMSKYFLTLQLSGGDIVQLFPGLVRMEYMRNTGAAFSFMSDMRWVLVAVSSVVILLIAVGLIKYRDKIEWVGKLGLALILGGALSNLIDRALLGYVADFFEFEFVQFAVFNVADMFITVGAVVFCLWYLIRGSKHDGLREEFMLAKKKKGTPGTPDNTAPEQGDKADGITPEDCGGADQT